MKKIAVITGASSGIGREFANQLAITHDLVLIARNESALQDAQAELKEKFPDRSIQIMAKDLTNSTDLNSVYTFLSDEQNLDLLINNAGFGTVGEFATNDILMEQQQIQLNISALVSLTHAALQSMKKQGRGGIVNVASIAAYLPAPYSAIYAATKAFVRSFTESIYEESKSYGIVVQSLCPGLTHSDFHQRAGIEKSDFPGFLWMESAEVVRDSIKALESKKAVCIPGGVNQTAVGITGFIPSGLTRKLAGMIMKK
jgi:short-subunit dehydrogenase